MAYTNLFRKLAQAWGVETEANTEFGALNAIAENPPFGTKTEIEYVELYSTTDWLAGGSLGGNEKNIYNRSMPDGSKINFIAGKKYAVNVSGKEFTFIAEAVDVNGTKVVKIGADLISLYEADFSVHKFAMYTSSARTTTIWHDDLCLHNFMPELSASAHGISLKVYEVNEVEIVKQLDTKFMPEGYPKVERKVVEIVPEQSVTGQEVGDITYTIPTIPDEIKTITPNSQSKYTAVVNSVKIPLNYYEEDGVVWISHNDYGDADFIQLYVDMGMLLSIEWAKELGETITLAIYAAQEVV